MGVYARTVECAEEHGTPKAGKHPDEVCARDLVERREINWARGQREIIVDVCSVGPE